MPSEDTTAFSNTSLDAGSDDEGSTAAKIRHMRVTCVLAACLFAAFAIIDIWAIPSALHQAWLIRAVIIVFLLGVLMLAKKPIFVEHYVAFVVTIYVVMALAIDAIIFLSEAKELGRDVYYVGLILVIMGLFTWVHLPLRCTVLTATGIIASYCVVMFAHYDYLVSDQFPRVGMSVLFLISATIVGSMSQTLRERYAAENRRLRQSLCSELATKERERQESEFAARHDPLTLLPNRVHLEEQFLELRAQASAHARRLASLFIDIDQFKPINDAHGHLVGDRVLQLLAQRLRNCVRHNDVIARVGGDEFVALIMLDHATENRTEALRNKFIQVIQSPMNIGDETFDISASIGLAVFPGDGDTLVELLEVADKRMYESKRARKQKHSNQEP